METGTLDMTGAAGPEGATTSGQGKFMDNGGHGKPSFPVAGFGRVEME
jgi:hypothetical protein